VHPWLEPCLPVRRGLIDQLRGLGMTCDAVADTAEGAVCARAAEAGGGAFDVVIAATPPGISAAPAWIRLCRDGDPAPLGVNPAADLAKPVRRWRLYAALHDALGRGRSRRAATSRSIATIQPLRVLVAEDNPINQLVTTGLLEALGCTATCVADGAAALAAIARETFDVVLMDCQMPVLDGYDATRELRRREQAHGGAALPVIALTANASREDRERCLAAGMDAFLSKPFRSEDLAELLRRHGAARLAGLIAPCELIAGDPAGSASRPIPLAALPVMPPPAALPVVPPPAVAVALPAAPAPASAPPRPAIAPATVIAPRIAPPPPPSVPAITTRIALIDPGPAEPSELPIVDTRALARVRAVQRAGRPALLPRIAAMYRERSPALVAELTALAAAGDAAGVARVAHDLKGTSGNLGLARLVDGVAQIERAARGGDLAPAAAPLAELAARHAEALAALADEIPMVQEVDRAG
jgi:CheY-like chemotaxis protein